MDRLSFPCCCWRLFEEDEKGVWGQGRQRRPNESEEGMYKEAWRKGREGEVRMKAAWEAPNSHCHVTGHWEPEVSGMMMVIYRLWEGQASWPGQPCLPGHRFHHHAAKAEGKESETRLLGTKKARQRQETFVIDTWRWDRFTIIVSLGREGVGRKEERLENILCFSEIGC